jgi:hypothetical protein
MGSSGDFDRGYEGHARRLARLGLALTAAERLRWLEETMDGLRRLPGRATGAPRVAPAPPAGE